MIPISVVIITKNEADILSRSLSKALRITDDVIIIDSGSTDDTLSIAQKAGCRVYLKNWDGYAANKNKGIALAKHNWILSIDADEVIDECLITELYQLSLENTGIVYDINFKSYFGQKHIRFGKWGRDHHIRLFNRLHVKWSNSPVHETLDIPAGVIKKKLNGTIEHYSVTGIDDFRSKSINYAYLSAGKYFKQGKRASLIKLYGSPIFSFVKNYVFNLGFLDGAVGLQIALLTLQHTRLKYDILKQMQLALNVKGSNIIVIENAKLVSYWIILLMHIFL